MEGQFKVGEVLAGQNCMRLTMYNGMECEVTASLGYHPVRSSEDGSVITKYCYLVTWADGYKSGARPDQLRRKQPPSGEQSIIAMFKVSLPNRIGEIA